MATRQQQFLKGSSKSAGTSPVQQSKLQILIPDPPQSQPQTQPQSVTNEQLLEAINVIKTEIKTEIKDIKTEIKDIKTEIKEDIKEVKTEVQKLQEENDKMRDDIKMVFEGLATHLEGLNDRVESLELKVEENTALTERTEKAEKEILALQYDRMEYALRIRGVAEQKDEILGQMICESLAEKLQMAKENLAMQIVKVYRVNSWAARQKQLPRDIVVYFTSKNIRNDILYLSFKERILIEGKEATILKEIPPKILRSRKEYSFLVDELKKRGVQYRWQIPDGLTFLFAGRRRRVATIQEARIFYTDVLGPTGAAASGALVPLEKRGERQHQERKKQEEREAMVQAEAQVQTRAAARRKEEELIQLQNEAVGGAKPKKTLAEDLQGIAQRLQRPKNGN